MGFIRHALIGIALYEAMKYLLKNEETRFAANSIPATNSGEINNGSRLSTEDFKIDLRAGTDPEIPLTGMSHAKTDDVWKNSLANDELRAPDS